jgi:hypothetical protein
MLTADARDHLMAEKPRTDSKATPKRLNRSVRVGDAIAGALDPALKRRGFASRDIIAQWRAMAPQPYDSVALPDKLVWPRGERSATGATLYLRCAAGHQLALVHEAPRIAAAINRYFGYVLVDQIRLAITPFTPAATQKPQGTPGVDPAARAKIARAVDEVDDARLRDALTQLGLAVIVPKP